MLAEAVQALLVDTTAHGREEDHLLSPVLFISEDTFPRSHIAGFLSHTNRKRRVSVIPNTITGQKREAFMIGLGRLDPLSEGWHRGQAHHNDMLL